MKLEDCYKRIDKYMQSSDRYPRLVNVNNSDDMNSNLVPTILWVQI